MVHSMRCVLIGWALLLVLTSAFQAAAKSGPPLTKLLDAVPISLDHAEAQHTPGRARGGQGQLDAAIAEYRKAIRLNPNDAEAHSNLGFAFARLGQFDAAVAECREAIRLDPKLAAAHVNLGMALARQGKVSAAIPEFRKAIRLAPNLAQAHSNLGAALVSRGKLDAATGELREAIRLNPNLAIAHTSLGLVLRLQGKIDAAVAEFREAIRLNPNLAAAQTGLGVVLADQGNVLLWSGEYDKAVKTYREALSLHPDFPSLHVHIAYTHFLNNRFEHALAQFENYFGLWDSPYGGANSYVKTWQYLSLKSLGKDDEAQKLLEDFARGFRGKGWELSVFRYHQGELSESELISRAKDKGQQCEAYFYIGSQYLLRGDKQKAREYFQETVGTRSFGYLERVGAQARLEQLGVSVRLHTLP